MTTLEQRKALKEAAEKIIYLRGSSAADKTVLYAKVDFHELASEETILDLLAELEAAETVAAAKSRRLVWNKTTLNTDMVIGAVIAKNKAIEERSRGLDFEQDSAIKAELNHINACENIDDLEKEIESLRVRLEVAERDVERMKFLHTYNKDADGFEWEVVKIRFDSDGKIQQCFFGRADSSDIDAAIAERKK